MPKHGPKLPTGTTVRVMFQECQCDSAYLNQPETVIPLMQQAVRAVKLNDLNFTHWAFDGGGSTLAFILSESHVAMHTWPEFDHMVLIDVSVCDFRLSNRARTIALCDKFADIFKPRKVLREIEDMIPRLEEITPQGVSQALEVESVVEMRSSALQDIMIADTRGFGRTLMINGVLQIAEREHHFYTENMVHVPLLQVDQPKRVLVCGGVDGASARHVLMHPSVERCVVVDTDAVVLELCRDHMRSVHQGSFDDARCDFVASNVPSWVQSHHTDAASTYDCVLFDTTDPASMAESLFSEALLQQVAGMLTPGKGVLALHIGPPAQYPAVATKVVSLVAKQFRVVYPYWSYVPLYGTYLVWLLCFQDESAQLLSSLPELKRRIDDRGLATRTQVVTWDTYLSIFTVPPCVRAGGLQHEGLRFYTPSL